MQVYDPKTGIQREMQTQREAIPSDIPINPNVVSQFPSVPQFPGNNTQAMPLSSLTSMQIGGVNVIVLAVVIILAYLIARR